MSRETSRGMASVTLICDVFGISRQAYYAARRPKRPSKPASVAAKKPPWATTGELREAIHALVADNPAWGVRKIWAALRRQGLRASLKRIWSIMKADGLTMEPVAVRESPGRYGHVSVPESNRRWGTDLTTCWTKDDGVVAVVPLIDYGDRVALACHVTKSQDADAVLSPVARVLEDQFGDPGRVPPGLELRMDHGPQFTGSDCKDLCEDWGVEQSFAPVGRPTGNAIVERFIQTLKIELIWTRDWQSLEELQAAIDAWVIKYNGHRPHQAMDWSTPNEKRTANLGLRLEKAA